MTHVSVNRLYPTTKASCTIDSDGNIIKVYYSMTDLSKEHGVDPRRVYNCFIGTRDNYFGLRFREYDVEKEDYIRTRFDNPEFKYKSTRRRRIKCIETGQVFKSQIEASRILGINQGLISNYVLGKRTESVNGYTFEEIEGRFEV